MTSLRRSVLIWASLLIAVIATASVIATWHVAIVEVNKLLDNELQQIAINAGQGLSEAAYASLKRTEIENRVAVQVWTEAGELIHKSPGTQTLPRSSDTGFSDIVVEGNAWRVYTGSDGHRFAQVAQRQSARLEIANHTAAAAAVPLLAALPIAWIAAIFGLNSLIQRVEGFANLLALRGVESKEPVVADEMPREFLPVVGAINGLIDKHQQAIEQQKQFVSEAAHELRTPLAALQIQVDNLRNRPNAESVRELGDGIRRATAMVAQLLRLARLDAPDLPGEGADIDLKELVLSIISDFVPMSTRDGVDLAVAVKESIRIKASDAEVRLLFANLIENAIRYTPRGGNVEVSIERACPNARVEIRDSGIGIPEDALPRIFDRFYRAAPPDIEGTGLGLAIASKIAERNRFDLSVANRTDGKGVLAQILIPLSV
jgi:two-component system, OmpR family, sensor kinase